jgi:hypothetical protein
LSRNLWKAAIGTVVSKGWLRSIPVNIESSELLIRAILSPYHVKKKKLQRGAFDAPPDSDEVSVSRRRYVSPWLSKAYAKRWVQRPDGSPPKIYKGLAFISADVIRALKSEVVDSRSEYLGHADIKNGIVRKRGEALPPNIRKELDDRLDKIAKAANYIEDDEPNRFRWVHAG